MSSKLPHTQTIFFKYFFIWQNNYYIFCNYTIVQGFIALTLSVCLVTASAQPLFLAPGVTAAFTVPGGLVLSSAAVAANAAAGTPAIPAAVLATIPTGAILAGKAALIGKALLLKAYLDEREKNRNLE